MRHMSLIHSGLVWDSQLSLSSPFWACVAEIHVRSFVEQEARRAGCSGLFDAPWAVLALAWAPCAWAGLAAMGLRGPLGRSGPLWAA